MKSLILLACENAADLFCNGQRSLSLVISTATIFLFAKKVWACQPQIHHSRFRQSSFAPFRNRRSRDIKELGSF